MHVEQGEACIFQGRQHVLSCYAQMAVIGLGCRRLFFHVLPFLLCTSARRQPAGMKESIRENRPAVTTG